jgi:hypothetical protein
MPDSPEASMTLTQEPAAPRPAAEPTAGYRVWIVPHTHWDREWYLPFQYYRMRLARTVDEIIEVLEQDPAFPCFTLDGQAVVLEDYLEVRPEREARLRALIACGRIPIGPSYVLPDEYLVGQESLVRNLLLGRQVCKRFGQPMRVGYMPDTFGHVAQMPQILRGFGLDNFIFWRGLGDAADEVGAIFTWEGPDGSSVTAVRQLNGYGNGFELGRWSWTRGDVRQHPEQWPDTAVERVTEFFDWYRAEYEKVGALGNDAEQADGTAGGLRDVLLCNGLDHQPIQRELPRLLDHCRRQLPNTELRIATYEDYLRALRERTLALKTYRGELCGGREANALRGVNSARMYLKQLNEATERALFVAEAVASLAALAANRRAQQGEGSRTGGAGDGRPPTADRRSRAYTDPLGELRHAWRELLRNQPHDSICGCSVDQVHRDMLPRYATAQQIADAVQTEALAALAETDTAWDYQFPPSAIRGALNVLPFARARALEIPLPRSLRNAPAVVAETADGPLPAQLYEAGARRCALVVMRVPGLGSQQVTLRRAERATTPAPGPRSLAPASRPSIENEFYRVEVEPRGTLAVTDMRTGQAYRGLHLLEDQADRGDEYNFCPLDGEQPWTSADTPARVRVRTDGPAVRELQIDLVARLPRALAPDRKGRARSAVPCPIRTTVRLAAGIERVEFRTTLVNRAKDHRLRVLFPTGGRPHPAYGRPLPLGEGLPPFPLPVGEGQGEGVYTAGGGKQGDGVPGAGAGIQGEGVPPRPEPAAAEVRVEGHFGVLRRPARPAWKGSDWLEPPADTHHTGGMLAVGELALFTKGLPEYEALRTPSGATLLALTLLRCVGWLSRDDLPTRPDGHAGPGMETPEAQCLGEHTFEYALSLGGDASDAALARAAQDYRVDFLLGPAGLDADGVLQVETEGALLSALKGAEDGNGQVLRLFNPGTEPTQARVSGVFGSACRCRLDETEETPDDARLVKLGGAEIVTLRLR